MIAAFWRYDRSNLPPEPRQLLFSVLKDLAQVLESQSVYSLCLTPERDNLVMWREYANSEDPISFSIRPRALRDMPVRIQKVEYIETGDTTLFDSVAEVQLDKLRFQRVETFDEGVRVEIVTAMLAAIYSAKHSTWAHEHEVRLTFAASRRSGTNYSYPLAVHPDDTEYPYSEPLVRGEGNAGIKYYEIPFGIYNDGKFDCSGAVAEIFIGPNCNVSANEISEFMNDCGMTNYKIVESECEYRPK